MQLTKIKWAAMGVFAYLILLGGIWKDAVPVFARAENISDMFDDSADNTWMFAGGTETQGRYEEVKGRRNFVGDIEESIRKGGSGGAPEHQRYTINVGKAGRDLAGFLEEMDDYVARLDPKAVSYMIEEEDYGKGVSGVAAFQENLSLLIQKGLSMKEDGGYVVIQLPHAVAGDKNADAGRYAEAARETVETFTDDRDRIRIVDHYAKTNSSSFFNGGNLTETGRLNGNGHFLIAEQFCRDVAGVWNNTSPVTKNWEETEGPRNYLPIQPIVTASSESLTVSLPEEFDSRQGVCWHLEIAGMEIEGTAKDAVFEISDLPQGRDYKLTVYSKDGGVSLTSVYGTILDGEKGGERKLNSIQQKIADKVKDEEPLTWLFLGDSITHGLVHTKGYDSTAQSFEKYIKEDLHRTDDVVVNTGVSATDTAWVLEHLYQRAEKYCPDVVFIMLGTNDVYSNKNAYHQVNGAGLVITKELYCQNMKAIVEKLRRVNPDVRIVFRAPSPVNREERNVYLDQGGYLDALEELAEEDGDILYVDQYRAWDKELRTFPYMWNVNFYFADSTLHPGVEGQMRMTRMVIDACGLNTDTKMANLSYQFQYDSEESAARPPIICGDHKVKIEKKALQEAYRSAGGTGTIGHLEICLTDKNGKTYTQRTLADGADFIMRGIPYGVYRADVTAVRTDAAVYTTFAAQTVELDETMKENVEILLERTGFTGLDAGDTAGVISAGDMAPDGRFTYTLCSGEGSEDNGYFQIKGRTLKIKKDLEKNREYKIRIRAEQGSVHKERAMVLLTAQPVDLARSEAGNAFIEDKTALDIDTGAFSFDGNRFIDLADASGSYYADGAYLEVLNHLKENSTGGTIVFRFRTSQPQALIFGAGSTSADDGKNMIFGLDASGKLRGHFRIASGNGLKGSMGASLADGAWHTVAMSFDLTKEDFQNQGLACIDGEASCFPSGWWTEAYRTWFSVNNADITQFAIGGGGYALENVFGAFTGDIDFVTITDQVYEEDMLQAISKEEAPPKAVTMISETGPFLVNGVEISVSGQNGFHIDHYVWNQDRSEAEIFLTARDGYTFDESVSARQADGSGYEALVFWETAGEAYVKLKKAAVPEEPDPKPEEEKMQLAAPEIISLYMAAEKKKAGVRVAVSKVTGGDLYTVYRMSKGKTERIGTTDAGGTVYDENPVNKKAALYYAVAESKNSAYKTSGNGKTKSIALPAAVKKVTAKQNSKKAQVRISWKKANGAKSYLIYRSEKKDTGFVRITKAKGVKKLSFDDKKVKKGKTYYYKVVVKTKKGYSAPKTSKKVKIR